jgi:hypothetical protein
MSCVYGFGDLPKLDRARTPPNQQLTASRQTQMYLETANPGYAASGRRAWKLRSDQLSPRDTTDWGELLSVR